MDFTYQKIEKTSIFNWKKCFLDRQTIKNLNDKENKIKFHHGLEMTLRNTWGLCGGSRLQKYFLDKKLITETICPH